MVKASEFYSTLYNNTYFRGSLTDEKCKKLILLQSMTSEQAGQVLNMLRDSIYVCDDTELQYIAEHKESIIPKVKGELRNDQIQGVAFMSISERCYIGDSTGLGKTVQTAALCNILRSRKEKESKIPFRYLYLGLKSSVAELHKKMTKFTGIYADLLLDATTDKVNKYIENTYTNGAVSLVATHDIINNMDFSVYLRRNPFDIIIIDECAFLTNPKTQIYKNTALALQKHRYRVLLNATPINTSILDIYYGLKILDDDYVPPITLFKADFCKISEKHKVGGLKQSRIDFWKKAISLRFKATIRSDAGAVFENNDVYKYSLVLSDEQRKLKRSTSMYAQLYDFPSDVTIGLKPTPINTPKVSCVFEILEKHIKGEKCLIYCYYRNAQLYLTEELRKRGYKVETTLNAGSKIDKITTKFQETDEIQILVTNISKALDMQMTNHLILYSLPTVPSIAKQFEGRMVRSMDVQNKNLYLVIMEKEEDYISSVITDRIKLHESTAKTDYSMFEEAMLLQKGDEHYYLRNYTD